MVIPTTTVRLALIGGDITWAEFQQAIQYLPDNWHGFSFRVALPVPTKIWLEEPPLERKQRILCFSKEQYPYHSFWNLKYDDVLVEYY